MAAKKESKEQRQKEEAAMAPASPDEDVRSAKKAKKSKKEKSKGRKRARRDSDAEAEEAAAPAASSAPEPPQEEPPLPSADKAARKAARAAKKAAQSAAKSNLLEQLPKTDADGIPFNKIQIRRMFRRVKHGLQPIATEEEEREIRMREKRERIEEEALYSATADDGDGGRGKVENEGEEGGAGLDGEENEPREADGPEEVDDNDNDSSDNEGGDAEAADSEPQKKTYRNPPPKKKAKRSKPVPTDYICQACNNQLDDFQPHWIYDCPQKKTQRGCNQVAKKLRGLHDPPSRKVFVSGLPFDCDERMVKRYFTEGMREKSGESGAGGEGGGGALGEDYDMVHCKLLKFEDSKRCKGAGFLTFASDAGAKLALKLNGAVWREVEEPGTKSKKKGKGKKGGEEPKERKELRLKVSKVLNRRVTKQKQRGKKQG